MYKYIFTFNIYKFPFISLSISSLYCHYPLPVVIIGSEVVEP